MDALFLRQVWAGNEAMLLDLVRDTSELGRARLHYFLINKGPWSRLDHDEPFIPGAPPKPRTGKLLSGGRDEGRGRGVAEDAARGGAHPRQGFFTTIRRDAGRQAHRGPLQPRVPGRAGASPPALLREAVGADDSSRR